MEGLTVTARPFPHAVVDGAWDADLLQRVVAEFPPPSAPGWGRFDNSNERKLQGPPGLWGPATRQLFEQIEATGPGLESAFGIGGLRMETVGGGYHCIEPGGYLAVHTDFNRSPRTNRWRRLNFLVFLNEDWQDPGGHLELWDAGGPAVDLPPVFNRTVVFESSASSWHGHPTPAARWRRSVAAYFFTDEPPRGVPEADQSTVWHGSGEPHGC